MFEVHLAGWYWTADNELRECVVINVLDEQIVLDAETDEEVSVLPADVMIEKPVP